jgi:nucleotide-binding universal stress UspA family protein
MTHTILVALDLDVAAHHAGVDRALVVGGALARQVGARLAAATVVPPGGWVGVDDMAALVLARGDRLGVTCDDVHVLLSDEIAPALVDRARADRALLCLAAHDRSPVDARALQSVSAHVVRRSRQPVLLVGPEVGTAVTAQAAAVAGGPAAFDVVLACVDGTSDEEAIVAEAARWARRLAVGLHVLEVVRRPGAPSGEPVDEAGWTSQWFAGTFAEQDVDLVWDEVTSRDPAAAIVAAAGRWAHPLVVMGTHGGGPHRIAPLGATAAAVVGRSAAPVLVVPPGYRRRFSPLPLRDGDGATAGRGT